MLIGSVFYLSESVFYGVFTDMFVRKVLFFSLQDMHWQTTKIDGIFDQDTLCDDEDDLYTSQ